MKCPICSDGPVVLPFNEGGGVGEIPNRHSICHYRITQHSKALNTEVGSNTVAAVLRVAPKGQLISKTIYGVVHGLRTPNEDINQQFLKNWADVADKICFGRT